jgi:hypothetical protein
MFFVVVVYANSVMLLFLLSLLLSFTKLFAAHTSNICFGISEQRTKPQGLGFCGTMAHHKNKQQKKVKQNFNSQDKYKMQH